jgi:hypothetical protein
VPEMLDKKNKFDSGLYAPKNLIWDIYEVLNKYNNATGMLIAIQKNL